MSSNDQASVEPTVPGNVDIVEPTAHANDTVEPVPTDRMITLTDTSADSEANDTREPVATRPKPVSQYDMALMTLDKDYAALLDTAEMIMHLNNREGSSPDELKHAHEQFSTLSSSVRRINAGIDWADQLPPLTPTLFPYVKESWDRSKHSDDVVPGIPAEIGWRELETSVRRMAEARDQFRSKSAELRDHFLELHAQAARTLSGNYSSPDQGGSRSTEAASKLLAIQNERKAETSRLSTLEQSVVSRASEVAEFWARALDTPLEYLGCIDQGVSSCLLSILDDSELGGFDALVSENVNDKLSQELSSISRELAHTELVFGRANERAGPSDHDGLEERLESLREKKQGWSSMLRAMGGWRFEKARRGQCSLGNTEHDDHTDDVPMASFDVKE